MNMRCCLGLGLHIPRALPSLSSSQSLFPSLSSISKLQKLPSNSTPNNKNAVASISEDPIANVHQKKPSLAFQVAALLATIGEPANAVTGDNNHEVPLSWILTQLGIVGFFYFLVFPPIIMNWLRIRWYRRNLLEMYLQFMCVFLFFPGILVWAPFLNFRKLPRDPSLKYPWATPEDPSQVKNAYLKYPFAKPEDYDW
ncbi:NAD(P)H-quinone oxidoreductase subunit L, chloroplastic isoform X2 [Momordica charantia]|uniref:NAD(P)H-quinone oxidoreductase subunit L, chloroplastic isoform X2 n=1 Tax=Momordica charantia TaxID=3673 RepID=A0A6J1DYB3_MOMCH|nr:NAD(P)H-quinone oxidoreductase subunit L, chloroplastic isoform X2 [Momordica charantia]